MTVYEAFNRPTIGKDTHTISQDNAIKLKKPDVFVDDPITDILRQGARKLLTQALEAEIEIFVHQYKDLVDELAGNGLFETAICQSGRFKPVSVWFRLMPPGSGIGQVNPQTGFISIRPFCCPIFVKRKALSS